MTSIGPCSWSIYYKLSKCGFGLWISAIAGVLIVLLSMPVFEEE